MGDNKSTIRGVGVGLTFVRFKFQLLVGKQRGQVFETRTQSRDLRIKTSHAVDTKQCRVLLIRGRRPEATDDRVALSKVVTAHLVYRDVDVVGRGVISLRAQEAVAIVAQVQQAFDLDEFTAVGLVGVGHGFAAESFASMRAVAAVAAVASAGLVREVARLALTGLVVLAGRLALGRSDFAGVLTNFGHGSIVRVLVEPLVDVVTSAWASATNSPRRSSKSSAGVATTRRERTARDGTSVLEVGSGFSPMIDSMRAALVARAETSTPFTLAIV